MTSALDRFKKRYADLTEIVCVLEERLEAAQARIAELEAAAVKPRAKRATKK